MKLSYRATKYGTVFIEGGGRLITTLRGAAAGRFVTRANATDEKGEQELMQRAVTNSRKVTERGDRT
jgi:hypothetical protein